MSTLATYEGGAATGLQEIIADARRNQAKQHALATFARDVLRQQGGLVIMRPNERRPAPDEVALKPSTTFLQATHPVQEQDEGPFVALRDSRRRDHIELVSLADSNPDGVAEAGEDDLLAVFDREKVSLPGVEKPSSVALGFTRSLLTVIAARLQPITFEAVLPQTRFHDQSAPTLSVRELSSLTELHTARGA